MLKSIQVTMMKVPNRYWSLIAGCIAIILINTFLYFFTGNNPNYSSIVEEQSRKGTSGFTYSYASKFFYFYYYKSQFPMVTLNEELDYSEEGADFELEENGSDLRMEYFHWSRLGENARIWAFLPNAMFKGSAESPSIKLFNTWVFVLSLLSLYYGFWLVQKLRLGIILVFLINCCYFYLYEVYYNENQFSLIACAFFIVLGLNLRFLYLKGFKWNHLVMISIFSGTILGVFSEMRNEVSAALLGLLTFLVLIDFGKWYLKAIPIVIVLVSFNLTKEGIKSHFASKFKESYALVKKYGGHTYDGDMIGGHRFWHPVFCGLGDFDDKYGYEWNDRVAYNYAVPILKEKYKIDAPYSGKLHLDKYYDTDSIYYVKFDEIEEYETIMKDKVLGDIVEDPIWYSGIIFQRIWSVLTITLPFQFAGLLIFPLFFLLVRTANWQHLKLIVASLPLSATSIIIFSGLGSTFTGVYAIFVIGISLDYIFLAWCSRK